MSSTSNSTSRPFSHLGSIAWTWVCLAVLVPLAISTLSACSDRSAEAAQPSIPSEPPQRILPVTASSADFVIDLIGTERIVAIAPVTLAYSGSAQAIEDWGDKVQGGAFSAEPVLGLRPDLVLVSPWQDAAAIGTLRRAGLSVLEMPDVNSFGGVEDSLELLGQYLHAETEAQALRESLQARIAKLAQLAAEHVKPGTTVLSYSNMGSGATVAGLDTSFQWMFELCGLENAANSLGQPGYQSIDNEQLLVMNPDWIVVGEPSETGPSTSAEILRNSAALGNLKAMGEGHLIVLPKVLYSANSHHIVDAAEFVMEAMLK